MDDIPHNFYFFFEMGKCYFLFCMSQRLVFWTKKVYLRKTVAEVDMSSVCE